MSIPFWNRLGVRLTLLLVACVLLLAVTTALIVMVGFRETSRNATDRSVQGLEAQARETLVELTEREARLSDAELRSAADLSRIAAGYLAAALAGRGELPPAPALVRSPDGEYYDADPARQSEVWIPNYASPTGMDLRDVRASALLEPLLPSLLAGQEAAVAVYFVNPHSVTRYFPVIGLHGVLPADLQIASQMTFVRAAPEANPERLTVWSAPYPDDAGHGLLITASTPVYVGGVFRGIVGVDVSLARLAARLDEARPSPGGFSFLLDGGSHVITAPERALFALFGRQAAPAPALGTKLDAIVLEEGGRPGMADAVRAMQAGETGLYQLAAGGQPALLAYAPLPSLGWSLGLLTPLRDITAPSESVAQAIRRDANQTIATALVITAAFFLLALLSATAFSRQLLARPIELLAAGTQALAGGKLGVTLRVDSRDELGALADAFNQMSLRLAEGRRTLLESETRFRSLADTAPVMMWMSGGDEYADYFNQGWLEFRGRTLEQEQGEGWLEGVHPEDRDHCVRAYAEASRKRQAFELEYRLQRHDGRYRWVLDRGIPRALPDGGIAGFIGSCLDVTDRVEARALLEQRVAERTKELRSLLDVGQSVALTLELGPLLDLILGKLRDVVAYDAAAVFLVEGANDLRLLHYLGPIPQERLERHWDLREALHSREVVVGKVPVVIGDVHADEPLALAFRAVAEGQLGSVPTYIGTWMGVPLIVRDRVIGLLTFDHGQAHAYDAHRVGLALAFANQVAVAVENARLFDEAQDKAALEERQKLARELHDSVSQALYGIALGARTARAQLGKNPEAAAEPIEYVLKLAQAGLAEMRALIFELRPESLEQEGLVVALAKQAASLRARHDLEVELDLGNEPALVLPAKQALYRIAQEALHNIAKHARARRVGLRLEGAGDRVRLFIHDDGAGFDPQAEFPGHLGLTSMFERAQALGGRCRIESQPGEGTRITVELPAPGGR
ncbi:MAG TPA: histidine kinase [Trueperaceae bacterium]